MGSILLQVHSDGNQNVVVGTLAEGLSFFLADSDDLISPAIDSDFFAQRIAACEQVVDNVGSHDSDLNVVVQVGLTHHAAGGQICVEDRCNRGSDALNVRVVN